MSWTFLATPNGSGVLVLVAVWVRQSADYILRDGGKRIKMEQEGLEWIRMDQNELEWIPIDLNGLEMVRLESLNVFDYL